MIDTLPPFPRRSRSSRLGPGACYAIVYYRCHYSIHFVVTTIPESSGHVRLGAECPGEPQRVHNTSTSTPRLQRHTASGTVQENLPREFGFGLSRDTPLMARVGSNHGRSLVFNLKDGHLACPMRQRYVPYSERIRCAFLVTEFRLEDPANSTWRDPPGPIPQSLFLLSISTWYVRPWADQPNLEEANCVLRGSP